MCAGLHSAGGARHVSNLLGSRWKRVTGPGQPETVPASKGAGMGEEEEGKREACGQTRPEGRMQALVPRLPCRPYPGLAAPQSRVPDMLGRAWPGMGRRPRLLPSFSRTQALCQSLLRLDGDGNAAEPVPPRHLSFPTGPGSDPGPVSASPHVTQGCVRGVVGGAGGASRQTLRVLVRGACPVPGSAPLRAGYEGPSPVPCPARGRRPVRCSHWKGPSQVPCPGQAQPRQQPTWKACLFQASAFRVPFPQRAPLGRSALPASGVRGPGSGLANTED